MFKKIIIWSVLVTVLLVGIATASYKYFWGTDPTKKSPLTKEETLESLTTERLSGRTNILIMGVDERTEDVGRSDTLAVLMIDPKLDKVTLLSIPRDTRVRIPGSGFDKINHAFAYGGHKLTQQTVEDLLGIKINYYALINFAGFKGIVDAVDGVDIYVDKDMYYEDPYDDLVIDIKKGVQHLNGEQAIHYVRYRDEEGDIGRVRRQQVFMKALYDKASAPSNAKKLPALLRAVTSMVTSNLYTADTFSIAYTLKSSVEKGLSAITVPGTPAYIDDISYWLPNIKELRSSISNIQGVDNNQKYIADTEKIANQYSSANYRATAEPVERSAVQSRKPETTTKNTTKEAADKNKTSTKPATTKQPAVTTPTTEKPQTPVRTEEPSKKPSPPEPARPAPARPAAPTPESTRPTAPAPTR